MPEPHGSVIINRRALSKKARMKQLTGAGLTSFAMALYLYSYGPMTRAQLAPTESVIEQVQEPLVTQVSASEAAPAQIPVDTTFSLYIPYLKIKSIVFPNVDAFDEASYGDALSKGVAQAKGTGLPGEGKRMFLFAHSTNSIFNIERYNAIFYDLGRIPEGETIELFYQGKVHQYRVTEKKVVSSKDVSWLEPHDGEELVLQTCYPPGTTWKRLLVIAKPV